MAMYVVLNREKMEVLDRSIVFEEGEKIQIETDGIKKSFTITSVSKVLQKTGNKCDVDIEIQLI